MKTLEITKNQALDLLRILQPQISQFLHDDEMFAVRGFKKTLKAAVQSYFEQIERFEKEINDCDMVLQGIKPAGIMSKEDYAKRKNLTALSSIELQRTEGIEVMNVEFEENSYDAAIAVFTRIGKDRYIAFGLDFERYLDMLDVLGANSTEIDSDVKQVDKKEQVN